MVAVLLQTPAARASTGSPWPVPGANLRGAETLTPAVQGQRFEARWADCAEDVRAAQRLRYLVFAQEMGAHLAPPAGSEPGLDIDHFDAFCDHLLVHAVTPLWGGLGPVVGTYRVLGPRAAVCAGGFYADAEFDLSPLRSLRATALELGRSCVHPAWRSGGVIMALWTALCRYMGQHGLDTMIGCASVKLGGETSATGLWESLRHTHGVAPQWQVTPHVAFPPGTEKAALAGAGRVCAPPLIKGYLRCGARLLGPPALDLAFNTGDLPMMLRLDELTPRFRKHVLSP